MSPRKVRRVVNLIRGKGVDQALTILHFTPKAARVPVEKTLRSAVANVMQQEEATKKIAPEDLYIKEARVDAGVTLKRYRAGSMGRAQPLRKRTCHITIVVAESERT